MSRVQFVRQMLPRICKDFYELEIYHNPTGSATFDPTLTTSVSTTVVWQTEAGTTVTTGTSHALSYTPTAGPKVCKITVLAGLRAVTAIDCNTDAITNLKNVRKIVNLTSFVFGANDDLVFNISDLSQCPVISCYGNTKTAIGVIGDLSSVCRQGTDIKYFYVGVSGSIASLPITLQKGYFYGMLGITAASIAHLVAIRDLRIYSMGWNAAGVDTVLLSASDAVWANAACYTYIAPALQIQTNAVPGGSSGADTTDPMTTPGSGNSNTDWEWDAGRGAHKALTGKAAIYFLSHNTGHAWIITYQTV